MKPDGVTGASQYSHIRPDGKRASSPSQPGLWKPSRLSSFGPTGSHNDSIPKGMWTSKQSSSTGNKLSEQESDYRPSIDSAGTTGIPQSEEPSPSIESPASKEAVILDMHRFHEESKNSEPPAGNSRKTSDFFTPQAAIRSETSRETILADVTSGSDSSTTSGQVPSDSDRSLQGIDMVPSQSATRISLEYEDTIPDITNGHSLPVSRLKGEHGFFAVNQEDISSSSWHVSTEVVSEPEITDASTKAKEGSPEPASQQIETSSEGLYESVTSPAPPDDERSESRAHLTSDGPNDNNGHRDEPVPYDEIAPGNQVLSQSLRDANSAAYYTPGDFPLPSTNCSKDIDGQMSQDHRADKDYTGEEDVKLAVNEGLDRVLAGSEAGPSILAESSLHLPQVSGEIALQLSPKETRSNELDVVNENDNLELPAEWKEDSGARNLSPGVDIHMLGKDKETQNRSARKSVVAVESDNSSPRTGDVDHTTNPDDAENRVESLITMLETLRKFREPSINRKLMNSEAPAGDDEQSHRTDKLEGPDPLPEPHTEPSLNPRSKNEEKRKSQDSEYDPFRPERYRMPRFARSGSSSDNDSQRFVTPLTSQTFPRKPQAGPSNYFVTTHSEEPQAEQATSEIDELRDQHTVTNHGEDSLFDDDERSEDNASPQSRIDIDPSDPSAQKPTSSDRLQKTQGIDDAYLESPESSANAMSENGWEEEVTNYYGEDAKEVRSPPVQQLEQSIAFSTISNPCSTNDQEIPATTNNPASNNLVNNRPQTPAERESPVSSEFTTPGARISKDNPAPLWYGDDGWTSPQSRGTQETKTSSPPSQVHVTFHNERAELHHQRGGSLSHDSLSQRPPLLPSHHGLTKRSEDWKSLNSTE